VGGGWAQAHPSPPTPLFRQRLARPERGDSLPGGAGEVGAEGRLTERKPGAFLTRGSGATPALSMGFSGPSFGLSEARTSNPLHRGCGHK
jgi:hypothetical protein